MGNPFEVGTGGVGNNKKDEIIRKQFVKRKTLLETFTEDSLELDFSSWDPDLEDCFDPENPDAQVYLKIADDKLSASMYVRAPKEGGKAITAELLAKTLKGQRIIFGLDKSALSKLLVPTYEEMVVVARGTAPAQGEPGSFTEVVERNPKLQKPENDENLLDYGALGLYRDVKAGTTICEINSPGPGLPGKNIFGERVEPVAGEIPGLPVGEGTRLSGSGKRLMTVLEGNLVFKDGVFQVEQELVIDSFPHGRGKIDFSQDVIINTDLPDGSSVASGTRVVLGGHVGTAKVTSKGDIKITGTMTSEGSTVLEAKRDIDATRLEDCKVTAGGSIKAGAIVNCDLECEGNVEVLKQEGLILSSKLRVFGYIKADKIGQEHGELTTINLGVSSQLMNQRKQLEETQEEITGHIEEMKNNFAYVERLTAEGRPVPPDRVQSLRRAQIQLPMSEKRYAQIGQSIAELDEKIADIRTSYLEADLIMPPVKINIGPESTNIIEETGPCRIYLSKTGELVKKKGK